MSTEKPTTDVPKELRKPVLDAARTENAKSIDKALMALTAEQRTSLLKAAEKDWARELRPQRMNLLRTRVNALNAGLTTTHEQAMAAATPASEVALTAKAPAPHPSGDTRPPATPTPTTRTPDFPQPMARPPAAPAPTAAAPSTQLNSPQFSPPKIDPGTIWAPSVQPSETRATTRPPAAPAATPTPAPGPARGTRATPVVIPTMERVAEGKV